MKYLLAILCLFAAFQNDTICAQQVDRQQDLRATTLCAIVHAAFPLPKYDLAELWFDSTNIIAKSDMHRQEGAGPASFFTDMLIIFCHHLDSKILVNLGQACKYLNAVLKVPALQLNDYCLQETMPQAMPLDVLVRKTQNTKDGVKKLAGLLSVSSSDLRNWFGQPYLQSVLRQTGWKLPEKVEGIEDNKLATLYPLVKILKAATPTENLEDWAQIDTFFEQCQSRVFNRISSHLYFILTLNPDQKVALRYLGRLIDEMILPSARYLKVSIAARNPKAFYEPIDIMLREYFLLGQSIIADRCSWYLYVFMQRCQRNAPLVEEMLQWCYTYIPVNENTHLFIRFACQKGLDGLALKFGQAVIDAPNTIKSRNDMLPVKVSSFLDLRDNPSIQPQMKRFAQDMLTIYNHGLQNGSLSKLFSDDDKKVLMRLFVSNGLTDGLEEKIKEIYVFPQHEDVVGFEDIDREIIDDFIRHGFINESKLVFQVILSQDIEGILLTMTNAEEFLKRMLRVDPNTLLPLLKAKIMECSSDIITSEFILDLFNLLGALGKKERGPEEVAFVNQYAAQFYQWTESFDPSNLGKRELHFALLYYNLDDIELCKTHHKKFITWTNKMIKEDNKSEVFAYFNEYFGIRAHSTKEIVSQYPIKMLNTYIRSNGKTRS
jgi:hypothetical protein